MSSAKLYKGYPREMSNEEIVNVIKSYNEVIVGSKGDINKVLQFSPLIQLGENELQSRKIEM